MSVNVDNIGPRAQCTGANCLVNKQLQIFVCLQILITLAPSLHIVCLLFKDYYIFPRFFSNYTAHTSVKSLNKGQKLLKCVIAVTHLLCLKYISSVNYLLL